MFNKRLLTYTMPLILLNYRTCTYDHGCAFLSNKLTTSQNAATDGCWTTTHTHSLCHVTSQTPADWPASSSGCRIPFSSELSPPAPSVHAPHIAYRQTHKDNQLQLSSIIITHTGNGQTF